MSSDSEDDCYGNVAQQLQKLKNRYREDKIDSAQLLNDSNELDEIVKNHPVPARNTRKSAGKKKEDSSGSGPTEELPDILVSTGNTSRRSTRSSAAARRCGVESEEPIPDLPPSRSRRKTNANTTANTSNSAPPSETTTRGRGRGKGKSKGRGRSRGGGRTWLPSPERGHTFNRQALLVELLSSFIAPAHDSGIPTYSVGNTEDYPDQSDCQPLFSNQKQKTSEVVIIDEENSISENEELNVKVYWMSSEFYKFAIRRFQKITQIFDYFAHKENVSKDKLLFRLGGKILRADDTPDSIGYTISKIIDGGIVEQGVCKLVSRDDDRGITNSIKLKFQCQNMKKPLELTVRPEDKLAVAMIKVAEHLERPVEKLKFEFDGDSISGKSTASELELEGGECIDVKTVN